MKQEEYLAAINKQQSLIRKLFASRKRRSECIDEITRERYDHLRGKFFKADGERFKRYKGVTYYIAAVHGETARNLIPSGVFDAPQSEGDSDKVQTCLECRYVMRSAPYPGVIMNDIKEHDNIAFFTETFRFDISDNLDEILAPLYITEESAAKEVSAMYDDFIKNFLKKG